ncbi:guanylate kinase [Paenibacillus endophyticus]|uniref:Guanylate kinase n=1 Tax=Paenibacillus endophyticus TaxID=1294268 RepID=A0A7W5CDJ1_9BACL|nr:guanylate kinase [Paenibacillus endophyticus]MBB3155705.1 guanylate kinase [Paenibacillus endophyticus]
MVKPYLFLFTGTSGSGRKTAAHKALQGSGIAHIPSCTDRPLRDKERPDMDYRYVSKEQFDQLAAEGFFTESVRIDRHRYGIGKRYLDLALHAGNSAYLILNREGSDTIRKLYGDRAIRIFLYVDKKTVSERLESKGTSFEIINSYLDHYSEEVTYRKYCEHIIENVTIEETVMQIKAIISSYLQAN